MQLARKNRFKAPEIPHPPSGAKLSFRGRIGLGVCMAKLSWQGAACLSLAQFWHCDSGLRKAFPLSALEGATWFPQDGHLCSFMGNCSPLGSDVLYKVSFLLEPKVSMRLDLTFYCACSPNREEMGYTGHQALPIYSL